ncbi:MAG TPA: NAD(P)-binding oxidoreductase [Paludibacter sp.]|nr:NAD(P)-binding oxidoreductase [Paludibacter sp.]
MKIVIFGANGKVGSVLVEQALAKGHTIVAYIREGTSVMKQHPKLKIIVGKLNESLKIADAVAGADACISSLGGKSLIRHAPEIVAGIDNIVTALEKQQVRRFIYLSSIGAGESQVMFPPLARFFITRLILRVPLADHNLNEGRIAASNLHWTIVRPTTLTNGRLSENLNHGIFKRRLPRNPVISRASLAAFMLKQVTDETYIHKCVWVYEKKD